MHSTALATTPMGRTRRRRTSLAVGLAIMLVVGAHAGAAGASEGLPREVASQGGTESNGRQDAAAREAGGSDQPVSHGTDGTAATTGSPGSPQPASSADDSGHGANTHGSYDSTRDGSPSGNGNGTGEATGKPCAGCVGRADNKNPQGQYPDGSDHNAGYECDRNHGIGRTNPAHTGCTPAPATAATTDTCPAGMVDTNGSASGGCVAPASSNGCPAGTVDMNGNHPVGCRTPATAVGKGCPVGMVDIDGSATGGCVVPGTGFVPCPVDMVDTNGTAADGCITTEVLRGTASEAVTAPATATTGRRAEFASAPTESSPDIGGGTVLARSTGLAVLDATLGNAATTLAFTGLNALTLAVLALVGITFGGVFLAASRRREHT